MLCSGCCFIHGHNVGGVEISGLCFFFSKIFFAFLFTRLTYTVYYKLAGNFKCFAGVYP